MNKAIQINGKDAAYIRNIAKGEIADIFLFDEIGFGGISGQRFAEEIKFLEEFGVSEINVHINTPGGSVLEGYSIVLAQLHASIPINTIAGIAASIGASILVAGDKRSILRFGRVMIHNPIGKKGIKDDAIESIRTSLIELFTSRTKLTKEKVEEMMAEETWLTAETAKEMGIVHEILDIEDIGKNVNEHSDISALMTICNKAIENKIKPKNKNAMSLTLITAALSLQSGSDESVIVNAINKLISDNADLKKENEKIEDLKNQIKERDEKIAETNKQNATIIVENAIKDGKLSKDNKEQLIENACKDIKAFNTMLSSIPTKAVDITNDLNDDGDNGNENGVPSERKDWDLRKWETEDPEGLGKIKNKHPETYNKMFESYYGTKVSV